MFIDFDRQNPFPSMRYQGSKVKLSSWIWECVQDLKFQTVLDAFGGTGCIAHLLKRKGKTVFYNDILKFNSIIGKALIENSSVTLPLEEAERLFEANPNAETFIQENFSGIFYTDEENRLLDNLVANIQELKNEFQRSLAWFALFQACIAKRPYNLFHRANLYLRMADVKRSFGNKTTWDKPTTSHGGRRPRRPAAVPSAKPPGGGVWQKSERGVPLAKLSKSVTIKNNDSKIPTFLELKK